MPTALLRALASRLDRCATSDGSGADVRTTDRWVATCCVEVDQLVALGAAAAGRGGSAAPAAATRARARARTRRGPRAQPRLARWRSRPSRRIAAPSSGPAARRRARRAGLPRHAGHPVGRADRRRRRRRRRRPAVGVNRPGYGTSTPTDSTMSSVADDAVAVLDLLGLDRVAVLGMSVGGAYAAALAARHPDRVAALAVVAAPRETPHRHGTARRRGRAGPTGVRRSGRPGVNAADPDDAALAARWLGSLPPDDAALLGAAALDRRTSPPPPARRWPATTATSATPRCSSPTGASTSRTSAAPPTSGTAPRTTATRRRPASGGPTGSPAPSSPSRPPPTWRPCSRTGRRSCARLHAGCTSRPRLQRSLRRSTTSSTSGGPVPASRCARYRDGAAAKPARRRFGAGRRRPATNGAGTQTQTQPDP